MSFFQDEYVGKRVLVQTNDQETDFIPAIIDGVDATGRDGNIKLIRFKKQSDGSVFYCTSGAIYPDTDDFRELMKFLNVRFPSVKDKFDFLREFKNFSKDLYYIAEKYSE